MPCLLLAADTLTACLLTALHLGYERCILMPDKPRETNTCADRKCEPHFFFFFFWLSPSHLSAYGSGRRVLARKPPAAAAELQLPICCLSKWWLGLASAPAGDAGPPLCSSSPCNPGVDLRGSCVGFLWTRLGWNRSSSSAKCHRAAQPRIQLGCVPGGAAALVL